MGARNSSSGRGSDENEQPTGGSQSHPRPHSWQHSQDHLGSRAEEDTDPPRSGTSVPQDIWSMSSLPYSGQLPPAGLGVRQPGWTHKSTKHDLKSRLALSSLLKAGKPCFDLSSLLLPLSLLFSCSRLL